MRNKIKKIAIIDYGMGNLFSVQHACQHNGLTAFLSSEKEQILNSDAIILPGVGAFGDAMTNLIKLDLIGPITDFIQMNKPLMGICLGMQLLFTESEEFGIHKGLNVLPGYIQKFQQPKLQEKKIKIPQIGWNKIIRPKNREWQNTPFSEIQDEEYMYFIHSLYAVPENNNSILSLTDYDGISYCSSILEKNIFAVQFHPEKSAKDGIQIIKNFAQTYNLS